MTITSPQCIDSNIIACNLDRNLIPYMHFFQFFSWYLRRYQAAEIVKTEPLKQSASYHPGRIGDTFKPCPICLLWITFTANQGAFRRYNVRPIWAMPCFAVRCVGGLSMNGRTPLSTLLKYPLISCSKFYSVVFDTNSVIEK